MQEDKKKSGKKLLNIKDIALIGIMTATLEVVKLALSFLPNIELVTLLIILYTLFFGRKVIYAIYIFVMLEGLLYGFDIWWFVYLYIWPFLAIVTGIFHKQKSVWFWSILSGVYGLCYGALCAIPYLFISNSGTGKGGLHVAFTWWIAGIPFDLIHGVSNFILMLVLYIPLVKVLNYSSTHFLK